MSRRTQQREHHVAVLLTRPAITLRQDWLGTVPTTPLISTSSSPGTRIRLNFISPAEFVTLQRLLNIDLNSLLFCVWLGANKKHPDGEEF
jgi:hypothetical protein